MKRGPRKVEEIHLSKRVPSPDKPIEKWHKEKKPTPMEIFDKRISKGLREMQNCSTIYSTHSRFVQMKKDRKAKTNTKCWQR